MEIGAQNNLCGAIFDSKFRYLSDYCVIRVNELPNCENRYRSNA